MPLFGKSQKSPAELVRSLKDAVTALERGDKKAEKAQEDVSKNLVSILLHINVWRSKFLLVTKWTIYSVDFVSIGFDKEHAIWHIRRRTTNGYHSSTVSSGTVQHQLASTSHPGI